MPEYIASGRDLHSDGSVKVSAMDDSQAFAEAKKKLPIVTGLERIEGDGCLQRVLGLPFDDPSTPLVSGSHAREEAEMKARRRGTMSRRIAYTVLFFLAVIVFELVWPTGILFRLLHGR